jgi:hypothetical protein
MTSYPTYFESDRFVYMNKRFQSDETTFSRSYFRDYNQPKCSNSSCNAYLESEISKSFDFDRKPVIALSNSNLNTSGAKYINNSCIELNHSGKEEHHSGEITMDESSTSSIDSCSSGSQNEFSYLMLSGVDNYSTVAEGMTMNWGEQPKINRGGRKQIKQGTTKRNARERNRVRFINHCFEILREHIPEDFLNASADSTASISLNEKRNRKLSKVETLKYASMYIRQLMDLLKSDFENSDHLTSLQAPASSSSNELYYNNQRLSAAVIGPSNCVRVSASSTSVHSKPSINETINATLNASVCLNSNMKNTTNCNNISFNNININIYDNRQQVIGEIFSPALSSCSSTSSSSSWLSSSSASSSSSSASSTLLAHTSSPMPFNLANQPIYASCNMSQSFMSLPANSANSNVACVEVDRHYLNNRFQDYHLKW